MIPGSAPALRRRCFLRRPGVSAETRCRQEKREEAQDWATLSGLVEAVVNADDPRHRRTGPDALLACELCTAEPLALLVASLPVQDAVRPPLSIGLVTPTLRRPVNTTAHASRARHKLERLCAAAGWAAPRPTARPAAVYRGHVPQVYSYGSIDPTAVALLDSNHIDEYWLPDGDIDAFGTFLELEQAAIDQHGPLSSSTLRHVASLRAAKLSLHAQGLVVRENKTVRLAPHLDTGALRTLAARSFPS